MEIKVNRYRLPLLLVLLCCPLIHLFAVFLGSWMQPELLCCSPYGFFPMLFIVVNPSFFTVLLTGIFPIFFALPPLLGWYRLDKGKLELGKQLFKITVLYTLGMAAVSIIFIYTEANEQAKLFSLLLAIAPVVYSLLIWFLSNKMAAENKE